MADYYFRCQRDYHRAEKELALARPAMPNSIAFFYPLWLYLHRREGDAGRRANAIFSARLTWIRGTSTRVNLLADTYVLLRQFDEAMAEYRPQHRRRARPSDHASAARIHPFRRDRRS